MRFRAVHISFSGSPTDEEITDGRTYAFFDPYKGLQPDHIIVAPGLTDVDSFCSSAVLLPDGRLLMSGGKGEGKGFRELTARESAFLDYRDGSVTCASDMHKPHWYGTLTKLPDARVIMTGGGILKAKGTYEKLVGNEEDISSTPEIYTEGIGWEKMRDAQSYDAFGGQNNHWWYPRSWVTSIGSVFGISTEKMWELFPNNGTDATIRIIGDFKTTPSRNAKRPPNVGPTSTAVMYAPGLILQVGGNGYKNGYPSRSSSLATIIDIRHIKRGIVNLNDTNPMGNARQWADANVLPNGMVCVSGGTAKGNNDGSDDVRAVELWDPSTGQWTTGAEAGVYRGYHSSAVLLRSGAIMASGGGLPGPVVNFNVQVYLPPYMFQKKRSRSIKASRPRILSMSSKSLDYNDILLLETSTEDIQVVCLIALPAVTHSFDANQRRMELYFQLSDGYVEVTMPPNANECPPGYYYLSIVDSRGFPSPAVIILISGKAPPPPPVSCKSGEETKGSLNSCVEQKKCFSLSYKKVENSGIKCEETDCKVSWKVCIEINRDNPCCTKQLRRNPNRAFRRSCIRGNEIDSCLNDDVSLDEIRPLKNVEFEDKICEIVGPGENAKFQLVSLYWVLGTRFLAPSSTFLWYTPAQPLQQDGKKCRGGAKGDIHTEVIGKDELEDGKATCFGTQQFNLDTCLGGRKRNSCTWIFPTPACPKDSTLS